MDLEQHWIFWRKTHDLNLMHHEMLGGADCKWWDEKATKWSLIIMAVCWRKCLSSSSRFLSVQMSFQPKRRWSLACQASDRWSFSKAMESGVMIAEAYLVGKHLKKNCISNTCKQQISCSLSLDYEVSSDSCTYPVFAVKTLLKQFPFRPIPGKLPPPVWCEWLPRKSLGPLGML